MSRAVSNTYEDIEIHTRENFFWDAELIEQSYKYMPYEKKPEYKVFCSSPVECSMIKSVSPANQIVTYFLSGAHLPIQTAVGENFSNGLNVRSMPKFPYVRQSYYFVISVVLLNIILIVGSFLFLKNTLLGFGLFFSSGIILIEAFFIYRVLKKKHFISFR